MARYRELVPEVRTHIANAPDVTVEIYLRIAAKQFCEDTGIWNVLLGETRVDPNADGTDIVVAVPSTGSNPDIVVPDQAVINKISRVSRDDEFEEERNICGHRYDEIAAMLTIPSEAIGQTTMIGVWAELEPTRRSTMIPDWLAERWGDGIVEYAIYRMMLMPNQEWRNPVLANTFLQEYEKRTSEAKVAKARGNTTQSIRMEPIPLI